MGHSYNIFSKWGSLLIGNQRSSNRVRKCQHIMHSHSNICWNRFQRSTSNVKGEFFLLVVIYLFLLTLNKYVFFMYSFHFIQTFHINWNDMTHWHSHIKFWKKKLYSNLNRPIRTLEFHSIKLFYFGSFSFGFSNVSSSSSFIIHIYFISPVYNWVFASNKLNGSQLEYITVTFICIDSFNTSYFFSNNY